MTKIVAIKTRDICRSNRFTKVKSTSYDIVKLVLTHGLLYLSIGKHARIYTLNLVYS